MKVWNFALAGHCLLLLWHVQAQVGGKCHVLESSESGFTAVGGAILIFTSIYKAEGHEIYFNDSLFKYKCSELPPGGWGDLFEIDEEVLKPTSLYQRGGGWGDCEILGIGDVHQRLGETGLPRQLAIEMGARSVWKPIKDIREQVAARFLDFEQLSGPTIAFHVRGGDKFWEDKHLGRVSTMPEDYVQAALRSWPGLLSNNSTCIIIGDDRGVVSRVADILRETSRCAIHESNPFASNEGHIQATFNSLPYEERCNQARQVIADLEILAQADYAVVSYTSGFAVIVESLRVGIHNKLRSTFVDASFQRSDLWSTIRHKILALTRRK